MTQHSSNNSINFNKFPPQLYANKRVFGQTHLHRPHTASLVRRKQSSACKRHRNCSQDFQKQTALSKMASVLSKRRRLLRAKLETSTKVYAKLPTTNNSNSNNNKILFAYLGWMGLLASHRGRQCCRPRVSISRFL